MERKRTSNGTGRAVEHEACTSQFVNGTLEEKTERKVELEKKSPKEQHQMERKTT